jgi:HEPN domain-containing protein
MMTRSEKVEFWLDIARYDLQTATAMFKSRRYLYTVFMCEQALEKLLKATYVAKVDENHPWGHDLGEIAIKKLPFLQFPPEYLQLFHQLSAFYLKGRYPSDKQKLSKLVNRQEAQETLALSKKAFRWLSSQLK